MLLRVIFLYFMDVRDAACLTKAAGACNVVYYIGMML